MPTVLVCGDSTLDNAPYVAPDGRALRDHLVGLLAGSWTVDFRALDGAVVADVAGAQLAARRRGGPFDALVVSVGGNDALASAGLVEAPERRTLLETGLLLGELQARFRNDYRAMLAAVRPLAPRLLVLVVYRGCFALDPGTPEERAVASNTLLSIYTDVMAEEARTVEADVLDLRTIFKGPELYANPIEPNDAGGEAVARRIADWLRVA
jgi:lysophospholipase L1-like esterase